MCHTRVIASPEMTPPQLTLFYAPRTRAFCGLWLMEELGVPYELHAFDLATGWHKSAEFLAMNPMGKVPAVRDGQALVSETGAIAIYLADKYSPGSLAPALDSPERATYLRWMFFAGSVMEPAFGEHFFKWEVPSSSVAWGSFADMKSTLITGLEAGPFLLGEQFTAADVVVGAAARFGVMFGVFDKDGPIAAYVDRVMARPAFERASSIEHREGERFPPKTG